MIGPTCVLNAGAYVAPVQASDFVLEIYDAAGDYRRVFASSGATRTAVLDLVAEWKAGVDLSAP